MPRAKPLNVAQIIAECGGSAALASKIGKAPAAVRMMKHRNVIPRVVWPEIVAAYPGITLDVLKGAEAVSPRRSPKVDAAA